MRIKSKEFVPVEFHSTSSFFGFRVRVSNSSTRCPRFSEFRHDAGRAGIESRLADQAAIELPGQRLHLFFSAVCTFWKS